MRNAAAPTPRPKPHQPAAQAFPEPGLFKTRLLGFLINSSPRAKERVTGQTAEAIASAAEHTVRPEFAKAVEGSPLTQGTIGNERAEPNIEIAVPFLADSPKTYASIYPAKTYKSCAVLKTGKPLDKLAKDFSLEST